MAGHRAGPALLAVTAADREPLFLVEPGHQLVVGAPALAFEQRVQPAIAIAPVFAGQRPKPLAQSGVFLRPKRLATGERPRDPDEPAGPPNSARGRDSPCSF